MQKWHFPRASALGSCIARCTSLRKGHSQVLGPIRGRCGLWLSKSRGVRTLPLTRPQGGHTPRHVEGVLHAARAGCLGVTSHHSALGLVVSGDRSTAILLCPVRPAFTELHAYAYTLSTPSGNPNQRLTSVRTSAPQCRPGEPLARHPMVRVARQTVVQDVLQIWMQSMWSPRAAARHEKKSGPIGQVQLYSDTKTKRPLGGLFRARHDRWHRERAQRLVLACRRNS